MNNLVQQKTRLLPLRQLKRMLGAAIHSTETDQKLISLGEDPDNLRKQLAYLIKTDKLYFESEKTMDRQEVADLIRRRITVPDKIIFLFDVDSWGDGWGGDWDTMVTTKERYVIMTIENAKLRVRMLETESEVNYMPAFPDQFHMKIYDPKVNYSLYEMIALHPKLIERLILILGSYEELLKLL